MEYTVSSYFDLQSDYQKCSLHKNCISLGKKDHCQASPIMGTVDEIDFISDIQLMSFEPTFSRIF